MAVLSAIFKGVDQISSIFDSMATAGLNAVNQLESAGVSASSALEEVSAGANSAVAAMESASASTDRWTAAVGNYDRSAMEATHSTEELVELGYKTEEALTAAASGASESVSAFQKSLNITEEFRASTAQLESELSQLQDAYIGTALQFGKNSDEAKALKQEIDDLSKIIGQNKEEFADLEKAAGKSGDTAADAVTAIQSALTAAGIAKLVSDITAAVIEMTNEFSEAEVIIAKATGATGDRLNSLSDSMMKLYAADDDSLAEVAGIVGELNTRLNLEGAELERVTSLFQAYTQATGTDGVNAVQSITKVMKNWGIEIQNTEGLLDKLTAAGQMSGISVDSLSNMAVQNKAVLQQLGYGLDESIALLAMFEYEGLNASQIMTGFRSAVNNFADSGQNASVAIRDVITEIAGMTSESDAAALAVQVFGSRAGPELAFAIRNGKFGIEEWVAAIGGADGTLTKTADAATTLQEKWSQASNKLKAAFSAELTPVVDAVSSAFAGTVGAIGDFLSKHPALVSMLTGLGAGLAAIVAILGAHSAAAAIAAVANTAFGASLKAAMGPTLIAVSAVAALAAGAITLADEIPVVTAVLSVLAAVIGGVTIALKLKAAAAGLSVAGLIAETAAATGTTGAMAVLNTVMAMNPAALVAIGVVALVAGLAALCLAISAANKEYNELSSTSKQQYTALQNLESEYESVCASQGETSDAAAELKNRLDEESAAFENSRKSMEQFAAECDSVTEAHQTLASGYKNSISDANVEELKVNALTKKLESLGSQTNLTAGQQEQMKAVINELNTTLPGLSLSYDEVASSLNSATDSVKAFAHAQAEQKKQEANQKAYAKFLEDQAVLERQLAAARKEQQAAYENWGNSGFFEQIADFKLLGHEIFSSTANKDLETANEKVKELESALGETNGILEEITNEFDEAALKAAGLADTQISGEEAAGIAIQSVASEVQALIAAYDEAYFAARESLDGMFGLFEKVEEKAGISSENIIAAWQSQIDYFNTYNENLQALSEFDLDADFLATLSDGSAESAGQVQALVGELNGMSADQASATVDNINLKFGELSQAKDTTAETMAAIKTDFDTKLGEITAKMESSVAGMNMSAEAGAAARNTMNAYVAEVQAGANRATAIARQAAADVAAALAGGGGGGGTPGYATGTLSAAPGLALVGENGPELINFGGGEVVYTTQETSRILADSGSSDFAPVNTQSYLGGNTPSGESPPQTGSSRKEITLNINGSGGINVSGANEETVWGIVLPRLKDALMSVLSTEIYEEGDGTYVF
jgi:phage-related minor tail protein